MDQNQQKDEKSELYKHAMELVNTALAELDELEKTDVNADPDGQGMEVVDTSGGAAPHAAESADVSAAAPATEATEDEEKKDESEETTPAAPAPEAKEEKTEKTEPKDGLEDLRKSYDERFSSLSKAIEGLTAKIDKLAKTPVGRKGISAVAPLRKSEDEQPKPKMNRYEIAQKLVKSQSEGNRSITPTLIAKVETGTQLTKSEFETVTKALVS